MIMRRRVVRRKLMLMRGDMRRIGVLLVGELLEGRVWRE